MRFPRKLPTLTLLCSLGVASALAQDSLLAGAAKNRILIEDLFGAEITDPGGETILAASLPVGLSELQGMEELQSLAERM